MDIIAAYREAGTYRGAAEIAGTTHKTVVAAAHVCPQLVVEHRLPRQPGQRWVIDPQRYPELLASVGRQRRAGPVQSGDPAGPQQRREQRLPGLAEELLVVRDPAGAHRRSQHRLLQQPAAGHEQVSIHRGYRRRLPRRGSGDLHLEAPGQAARPYCHLDDRHHARPVAAQVSMGPFWPRILVGFWVASFLISLPFQLLGCACPRPVSVEPGQWWWSMVADGGPGHVIYPTHQLPGHLLCVERGVRHKRLES
jgi:hypothetical protein